MTDLTPPQQITYALRGRINYWLYRSTRDRFLTLAWADWLRLLTLLLVPYLWLQTGRFPGLAVGLAVVVRVGYALAASRHFTRFIPQKDAAMLPSQPLPPEQRQSLRATGLFTASGRAERVLLRPATYWQTPLGTHVIMVAAWTDSYRYQRFKPENLTSVQAGWLLFGPEPLPALAVTFVANGAPPEPGSQFAFGEPPAAAAAKGEDETVYLTFDDTAVEAAVYHTLTRDLPQQA